MELKIKNMPYQNKREPLVKQAEILADDLLIYGLDTSSALLLSICNDLLKKKGCVHQLRKQDKDGQLESKCLTCGLETNIDKKEDAERLEVPNWYKLQQKPVEDRINEILAFLEVFVSEFYTYHTISISKKKVKKERCKHGVVRNYDKEGNAYTNCKDCFNPISPLNLVKIEELKNSDFKKGKSYDDMIELMGRKINQIIERINSL